ncbi:pentatricopeptide repeat-containing protein At2g35030, mitochondrial-like [Camellia sinensis]|uniref:pentatricopeptide repeat-containing protein At2g35030, mitochondrial-like n=1 Tax=Camellia sinensis TaxID=4442 RepID=UPI0010358742|nr:pentatricopeptide repeat-containing protein At2g35030, mitochondrial-like [Camellia sinensis]XP_028069430.1 pentatricopeptide repeat-containing protein At2g35030, mitochondrial-like [Camellia sinensis]XP_028069431.1 pentatricopeptide repeat-containing protein At2g35030, mitochondrial-like [Camellia sinensis]
MLSMQSFSRLSIALRHGRDFTIYPLLRSIRTLALTLCNLKLQWEFQSYLYHSANQFRTAELSIPKMDSYIYQSVKQTNWMITKLCREGQIVEARKLFDKMPDPDVIAWTSVISAYIHRGMIREARNLFDRVDAKKNVVTWTAMVSGYIRMNQISEAEKLFNEMPHKNLVSWNTMINGYLQSNLIDSALSLFEKMPERNLVSWNAVIAALGRCGRIEEARKLFDYMPKRNVISWTVIIDGLSKNGRIDEARVLFDTMPERNVVSRNMMITGYAKNLRLEEALELFERMPERDIPSWNAMITGFIQNGNLKKADKLFNEMPDKNVISWTTMITGYIQHGQSEEALRIFSRMQAANGVKPNQGTFISVLAACSNFAGLSEGHQIHQVICKTVHQNGAFVISALVNMYSKCGELSTARKMFDDGFAGQRDLISWNGMIAAYAHHGCGGEAISLFKEMQNLGIKPNDVTYVGLLAACSHAGLVDEGLKYFDELIKDKSIQVRQDHYSCLVGLCGRAGRVNEAFDFIQRLPIEPSGSVWGAFLAGCNVHGNTNMGKLAAKRLLELEPENAGTYMLLSNIYASSGKWREAARLRLKMKDKGLKKQPGCSWIDVGNKVHVFVVGDKSHSEANLIYSLIHDLHVKMKKVGYVSDNDFTMEEGFLVT